MAKVKEIQINLRKPRKKRPGIHSKTKYSKSKNSKNYVKLNVGQG